MRVEYEKDSHSNKRLASEIGSPSSASKRFKGKERDASSQVYCPQKTGTSWKPVYTFPNLPEGVTGKPDFVTNYSILTHSQPEIFLYSDGQAGNMEGLLNKIPEGEPVSGAFLIEGKPYYLRNTAMTWHALPEGVEYQGCHGGGSNVINFFSDGVVTSWNGQHFPRDEDGLIEVNGIWKYPIFKGRPFDLPEHIHEVGHADSPYFIFEKRKPVSDAYNAQEKIEGYSVADFEGNILQPDSQDGSYLVKDRKGKATVRFYPRDKQGRFHPGGESKQYFFPLPGNKFLCTAGRLYYPLKEDGTPDYGAHKKIQLPTRSKSDVSLAQSFQPPWHTLEASGIIVPDVKEPEVPDVEKPGTDSVPEFKIFGQAQSQGLDGTVKEYDLVLSQGVVEVIDRKTGFLCPQHGSALIGEDDSAFLPKMTKENGTQLEGAFYFALAGEDAGKPGRADAWKKVGEQAGFERESNDVRTLEKVLQSKGQGKILRLGSLENITYIHADTGHIVEEASDLLPGVMDDFSRILKPPAPKFERKPPIPLTRPPDEQQVIENYLSRRGLGAPRPPGALTPAQRRDRASLAILASQFRSGQRELTESMIEAVGGNIGVLPIRPTFPRHRPAVAPQPFLKTTKPSKLGSPAQGYPVFSPEPSQS